jgi:hypothetical protein
MLESALLSSECPYHNYRFLLDTGTVQKEFAGRGRIGIAYLVVRALSRSDTAAKMHFPLSTYRDREAKNLWNMLLMNRLSS